MPKRHWIIILPHFIKMQFLNAKYVRKYAVQKLFLFKFLNLLIPLKGGTIVVNKRIRSAEFFMCDI